MLALLTFESKEYLDISVFNNISSCHYESMPLNYAAIFKGCKNDNFS